MYRSKPKGEWANFDTECWKCCGEVTVSNGHVSPHDCQPDRPLTLADLRAALDNRN